MTKMSHTKIPNGNHSYFKMKGEQKKKIPIMVWLRHEKEWGFD
jgi:uncharacterized protein YpmB